MTSKTELPLGHSKFRGVVAVDIVATEALDLSVVELQRCDAGRGGEFSASRKKAGPVLDRNRMTSGQVDTYLAICSQVASRVPTKRAVVTREAEPR